ncbi:DUF4333 domain-containing protein [Mycolicibacterium palauense]|uniref:DUF4333 domain-containing protein n=1 Tax=Mycolicibacterium palauense TaxID=2034511 RepID=UPI000BFEE948|nr:DUF4333 domain-containing protein [Mycolicibacterium palauense]
MRSAGCAASSALVLLTVVGCGGGTPPPTVGRAELQKDIATKFDRAGRTPRSVTCRDDLQGVVGKTTRCEVVLGDSPDGSLDDAEAFEPIVTVTEVTGSTVRYEMTPALSQSQVEKSVENLLAENSGLAVDSVTCDSGLEGEQGNTVRCAIVIAGDAVAGTVTVTKVDGLTMNIGLTRG